MNGGRTGWIKAGAKRLAQGCTTWALVAVAVGATVAPGTVRASNLLPPAVGAADSATQGTRIADPYTPANALFANPAGLTQFDSLTHGGDLGVMAGRSRIEASAPINYAETRHMWALAPDFGVSVPYGNWRFALGSYGSTGSKFDYHGNAAAGVPSTYSETIIVSAPLAVAYQLTDRISVGAEVEGLFGQLRTHYPLSGLEFKYKINGPGVQGMLGASLRASERLSLGISVRTPGRLWMGGSMPVGSQRQRVECDLKMPTQLFLGATWRLRVPLTVSASTRYTNTRSFGDSPIEYQLTPQASMGFLPYGKDEWKFALGGEYEILERTTLRLGGSWATHTVGSKGVSSLVFDTDDFKVSVGAGQRFDGWTLDVALGWGPSAKREVPPGVAIALPGSYSSTGFLFMVGAMFN